MKVGTLLSNFLKKAGIDTTDAKFADVLSIQTEITDDIATKLEADLLTKDAAKNNPELKNYFYALALNGADDSMKSLMTELGLPDDLKTELTSEKNTMARIGKLVKKVQELEIKKAGTGGTEKAELQKQINSLTDKMSAISTEHQNKLNELQLKHSSELTNFQIRNLLTGKPYANKNIPAEVNTETALVLLNRELAAKGAKIVNTNGQLTLKRITDETLDWANESNHKPTIQEFVDGVLASNKLLEVTPPGGATPPPNGGLPGAGTIPPAEKQTKGLESFQQQLDSSMKDLSSQS